MPTWQAKGNKMQTSEISESNKEAYQAWRADMERRREAYQRSERIRRQREAEAFERAMVAQRRPGWLGLPARLVRSLSAIWREARHG